MAHSSQNPQTQAPTPATGQRRLADPVGELLARYPSMHGRTETDQAILNHIDLDAARDEVVRLRQALAEIELLPYLTEETAWTWKDVASKMAAIARAALAAGHVGEC